MWWHNRFKFMIDLRYLPIWVVREDWKAPRLPWKWRVKLGCIIVGRIISSRVSWDAPRTTIQHQIGFIYPRLLEISAWQLSQYLHKRSCQKRTSNWSSSSRKRSTTIIFWWANCIRSMSSKPRFSLLISNYLERVKRWPTTVSNRPHSKVTNYMDCSRFPKRSRPWESPWTTRHRANKTSKRTWRNMQQSTT